MKPLHLLLFLIILVSACKKDSESGPPRKTNSNKVTAIVTVAGRAPRNFIATGADSTSVGRSIDSVRQDTLYAISGGDGIGGISLVVVGIVPPGTYEFVDGEPGTNYPFITYIESELLNPTLLLSSNGTDTLGNQLSTGSFTIIKMTDTDIEGTASVNFGDGNSIVGKIESMYFKGTFENY